MREDQHRLMNEQATSSGARWGMIGEHASMRQVYRMIERLAACSTPVLILGETGTGKELVARALHATGKAKDGPLETINCAAIPRELAESELFGHASGAFTGATRGFAGAFERANGGTLFLDEIGEMPLELQPKLLRVLEEGELRRVGEERSRKVRVRIVAATHRRLEHDAEHGRFRFDLYHRLAVGIVALPPLRERREDIPLLVRHFLDELHTRSGKPRRLGLGPGVLPLLQVQRWRGNVRALRNAVERAAVTAGDVLFPLDFEFLGQAAPEAAHDGRVLYRDRAFAEVRREIFLRTLQHHRGNRSAAAAALGIPKSTFFDQLRAMSVDS